MINLKVFLVKNIFMAPFYFKIKQKNKLQSRITDIIIGRVLLTAMEMFPSNGLSINTNLAISFYAENMYTEAYQGDYINDYNKLKETLASNSFLNDYFSTIYLLDEYGLQLIPSTPSMKIQQKSTTLLEKATLFNKNSSRFTNKTYKEFSKKVKIVAKEIKQDIQESRKQIYRDGRQKHIGVIDISKDNIAFIISLMSTFFVVGGYLYITFLLNHFNIDSSYYYTITDYLSSSINTIAIIFLSSIVGLFSFIIGAIDNIDDKIYASQLDSTDQKKSNTLNPIHILIFFSLFSLLIGYFSTNISVITSSIQLTAFTCLIILLGKSNILSYVKNESTILFLIISSFFFFTSTLSKSYTKIDEMRSDTYKPDTSLILSKEYKEFENMRVITMNSNYIFLWDKENNQSVVIPKSSINFTKQSLDN